MQEQALPGFREFYPDDLAVRTHIFAAWRKVAGRYGFVEYDGPPLEPLSLYTQKSGDEIIAQLYAFEDKGKRQVALRPEMTPTLARMVGSKGTSMMKPVRWFSIPQLFRYERPQRGRLREHFQLNMDILGEESALADAEIIAAAIDIQRDLGLKATDVCVRLSHRGVVQELLLQRGVPPDALDATLVALDKVDVDAPRAVEQVRGILVKLAVGEELASKVIEVASIRDWGALENLVGPQAGSLSNNVQNLLECRDALFHMGLGEFVRLDTSVVRGLAYYTGVVFELFDVNQKLRAICGGGRYDDLVLQVTGRTSMPCVGFGMGDVVLTEILKERELLPTQTSQVDIYIASATRLNDGVVLKLAHDLRERGRRVEYALEPHTVRKQIESAAKRLAEYVVIVGVADLTSNVVVLKDLDSGEEQELTIEAVLERFRDNG